MSTLQPARGTAWENFNDGLARKFSDNDGMRFDTLEAALEHGQTQRLIRVDDKAYRWRRGKLKEIPAEWVGKTVHPQTLRKRKMRQRGVL